jgi:hypothetical protein
MKPTLVQTTLYDLEDLNKIISTNTLGKDKEAIGFQPPIFENIPLSFCSYVCEGYSQIYGDPLGIIFKPDAPVVYACPCDSFNLLRGGNWLKDYEQFLFSSIEEMLKKYPTTLDFKKDFQKYFRNLKPHEVYPRNKREFAKIKFNLDYCLRDNWNVGCNEVTFRKPTKIKNPIIFNSKEDLQRLLKD